MFRITGEIFKEILSLEDFLLLTYGKEQNEYYEEEMAILEEVADKTIEQIADNEDKTTYLDLTKEELYEDLLQGDHQVFVILENSLLYNALGYVYGSYDGVEIAQKNGKLAKLDDGNLYFFTGYNYDYIDELFQDLGGRQAFLKALSE